MLKTKLQINSNCAVAESPLWPYYCLPVLVLHKYIKQINGLVKKQLNASIVWSDQSSRWENRGEWSRCI